MSYDSRIQQRSSRKDIIPVMRAELIDGAFGDLLKSKEASAKSNARVLRYTNILVIARLIYKRLHIVLLNFKDCSLRYVNSHQS